MCKDKEQRLGTLMSWPRVTNPVNYNPEIWTWRAWLQHLCFSKPCPPILSARTEAVYTVFRHSVSITKTAATDLMTYRVSGTMSKILHCLSYLRDDSPSLCARVFKTMHPFSFSFHKNSTHPRTRFLFNNSLFIRAGRALGLTQQSMTWGHWEFVKLQSILYSLSHSVLIREMKVPVSPPELFRGWHEDTTRGECVCTLPRTWQDRHGNWPCSYSSQDLQPNCFCALTF